MLVHIEKRRRSDGYLEVLLPMHPAAVEGWVLEHRLVMELALGARLPSGIHVHHRDLNPANNELENLLACPDRVVHDVIHDAIRRDAKEELEAAEKLCIEFAETVKRRLEAERAVLFEPVHLDETQPVGDREKLTFIQSLSASTRDEVMRTLKSLTRHSKPRDPEFPRAGLEWSRAETALVSALLKQHADARMIGALLGRPPATVVRELPYLFPPPTKQKRTRP